MATWIADLPTILFGQELRVLCTLGKQDRIERLPVIFDSTYVRLHGRTEAPEFLLRNQISLAASALSSLVLLASFYD